MKSPSHSSFGLSNFTNSHENIVCDVCTPDLLHFPPLLRYVRGIIVEQKKQVFLKKNKTKISNQNPGLSHVALGTWVNDLPTSSRRFYICKMEISGHIIELWRLNKMTSVTLSDRYYYYLINGSCYYYYYQLPCTLLFLLFPQFLQLEKINVSLRFISNATCSGIFLDFSQLS